MMSQFLLDNQRESFKKFRTIRQHFESVMFSITRARNSTMEILLVSFSNCDRFGHYQCYTFRVHIFATKIIPKILENYVLLK